MLTRPAIALLLALAILPACRPTPPSASATPTPRKVLVFTQYSPGDTLKLVQIQLNLDYYQVRYRTSMPAGQMGMVYFLDDGNLHIDAKKIGDTWVLLSTPLLDPSDTSAADRVAQWDRASDSQNTHSASKQ